MQIELLNTKYTTPVEKIDTAALNLNFHDDMIITGPKGWQRDKKSEISESLLPGTKV